MVPAHLAVCCRKTSINYASCDKRHFSHEMAGIMDKKVARPGLAAAGRVLKYSGVPRGHLLLWCGDCALIVPGDPPCLTG